jgi:hypothetical protein
MPYCTNCGAQINSSLNFCGNCGAKIQTPQTPTSVSQATQSPPVTSPSVTLNSPVTQPIPQVPPVQTRAVETVLGAIVVRKPKSMGRWDTYTGVITSQRLIIAQMTSKMITDAAKQSRDQAKAEGKGFFGQWADQLRATWNYSQRYLSMQPQSILNETPGNFAIDNTTISSIKVHLKGAHHEQNQRREFELKFHTTQGTFEYHMDENSDFINALKSVYGQRVEMPFGYFGGINIKI